jgi:gentisate 1,2-dioxygenase
MSTSALGTLDDLPKLYRDTLSKANLVPLWPALRSFLPYGMPERKCAPTIWRYNEVRPLLLQAGDLTPIEKAERRVLILANPTLDPATARATPTIYLGLQLIKPGETAPNHKHSPSAIRFVVEGEGGFTMVEGEKLPMDKGDLILTPSGRWHEHGHSGKGPVVWLDALDLPLIYSIEASYCIEGAPPNVVQHAGSFPNRLPALRLAAVQRARKQIEQISAETLPVVRGPRGSVGCCRQLRAGSDGAPRLCEPRNRSRMPPDIGRFGARTPPC